MVQVRRQNFSLDETVGRLSKQGNEIKYRSLDDTMVNLKVSQEQKSEQSENYTTDSLSRSVSPLEPKSDSVVINNQKNSQVRKL